MATAWEVVWEAAWEVVWEAAWVAAWAEDSGETKQEVVAQAAVLVLVVPMEVITEEVLVVAREASEAVGTAVASKYSLVSSPSHGELRKGKIAFLVNKFMCIQK